jgi:hypothetical protein
MRFNKKIAIITGLLSGIIVLASMTFVQQTPPQQPRVEPKLVNIKVLPKQMTYREVDHMMDQWAASLGVKCSFCHVRNEATRKSDYPNDSKPEKLMARKMYLMTTRINKKYFKAVKDSLGMNFSSVNCYTCHRGVAKLDKATWPKQNGPGGGQRPPGGQAGPGGQSGPQGATGSSSSPEKKP